MPQPTTTHHPPAAAYPSAPGTATRAARRPPTASSVPATVPLYHGRGWGLRAPTLPNGLRVLTAPMPHAQSVDLRRDARRGLALRDAETTGSRTSPSTCSSRAPSGGRRRATSPARSTRSAASSTPSRQGVHGLLRPGAAEHRDMALDVLVDMLRNSRFDPEEIEREKGVIIEEMNMYFDTPRDFIGGVYESLLFGDQPLGWDIIGRKETVRGATRETFLDYIGTWYRPNADGRRRRRPDRRRAARPARGAARRPAGRRDAGAPSRQPVAEGARQGAHEAVRPGAPRPRRPQPPARSHPDRYALQLLATVLGGGMSSRLFTEVRERRGLAYYVFGTNHAYTDAGTLYSQAGVDINRIDEAMTTIVEQFRLLAAEPVPPTSSRRPATSPRALRAPAREPARDDHVRAAPRGAGGRGRRAGGGARRDRRGDRRGHPARRAGIIDDGPVSRRDRAVRRRERFEQLLD